ncbi:gliding motility protein GldN [Aureivirga sp. CE67]|uniref:type IX secretion system ring protein PorN/GldN n=1 Tax=Aureivirga sp. CE67 TaxID=1788983 RepID=UPI0018C91A30|nr:gliding motility protein GldN [Aureivirga sp. CE67]
MNWKSFTVAAVALFTTGIASAQSNLLNATSPEEIGKKTQQQKDADNNDNPLEYGFVDDRDLLWSKVTWEYIDLNERINLPLYYPVDTNNISSDRRSLYDTLLKGIRQGKVTKIYDDSYFTTSMTIKEIDEKLVRIDTSDYAIDLLNEDPNADIRDYVDTYNLESRHVVGFQIRGVWYFDKRQGELKYRLIGLAPVTPDVQTLGKEDELGESEKLPLFWVYYPDARYVLHNAKAFNEKNSAYPISYDHLLNARRFNGIIYRSENVYGNRDVRDYVRGNSLFQVLESDRIKDEIRSKEHDMWSY